MNIDISQLDKAHVLCALYNRATCSGMGRLHYIAGFMKYADAQALLKKANYFDYLLGRVMKVDISEPWCRTLSSYNDDSHVSFNDLADYIEKAL